MDVRGLASAQVHSVVFATSGTLLLCFVDVSGRLAGLRCSMRTTFTGKHPCHPTSPPFACCPRVGADPFYEHVQLCVSWVVTRRIGN